MSSLKLSHSLLCSVRFVFISTFNRTQLSGVCWGAVYCSIESISLNHPVHQFTAKNFLQNFSRKMIKFRQMWAQDITGNRRHYLCDITQIRHHCFHGISGRCPQLNASSNLVTLPYPRIRTELTTSNSEENLYLSPICVPIQSRTEFIVNKKIKHALWLFQNWEAFRKDVKKIRN